MKLAERSEVVEAVQWNKLGDHVAVMGWMLYESDLMEWLFHEKNCRLCNKQFRDHGKLNTGFYWQLVCPGDWIVNRVDSKLPTYFRLSNDDINEHYVELREDDRIKLTG